MLSRKTLREILIGSLALLILVPAPLRASQASALAGLDPARGQDSKPVRPGEKKHPSIPLVLTVADGLPPRSVETSTTEPLQRDPARAAVESALGWKAAPQFSTAVGSIECGPLVSNYRGSLALMLEPAPLGALNGEPNLSTQKSLRTTCPAHAPPQR